IAEERRRMAKKHKITVGLSIVILLLLAVTYKTWRSWLWPRPSVNADFPIGEDDEQRKDDTSKKTARPGKAVRKVEIGALIEPETLKSNIIDTKDASLSDDERKLIDIHDTFQEVPA